MNEVVVVLRVALAVTFVVSAVAKVVQWRDLPASAAALGVPRPVAAAARLLPFLELSVAGLLVATSTARAGAVLALGLLGALTALLLVNLVRGRRPSCSCFGRLSSRPISWWSIGRNTVLAVATLVIAGSAGGEPLLDALGDHDPAVAGLTAAVVALTVGVGLQAWALLRLLRQHGRLLLRIEAIERPTMPVVVNNDQPGLAVGAAAPEFALAGLHGETMTLAALRAGGKPVLLVFSDASCGPCNALAPSLADWQRRHADRLRVVVLATGDGDSNRAKAAEHGLADVFLQEQTDVGALYRYQGTPGAVLVDVAGRVAAPLASGGPAIEALVDRVVGTVLVELGRRIDLDQHHGHAHGHDHHGSPSASIGLPVGDEAPPFRLPTVGGGDASLGEFRGRATVLLFWNPRCGFCESLRPDLLEWEATRGADAAALLVVSTGDEAANAAEGFSSTVALDATSSTMSAYRVNGTPMAVLVDEHGRIGSPTGVGGPAVLEILRSTQKESA